MPAYYKRTRFLSAYAGSNNVTNVKHDPSATGDVDWQDNYGELGAHSNTVYNPGSAGAGYDTGVLPNITFNLDPTHTFYIRGLNSSWAGDKAEMNLEFLNASDAVVAALKTVDNGNYGHDLKYGATLAGAVASGGAGYKQTDGVLTFSSTQMIFTSNISTNYNASFTFNCSANTITKVRISGVRAKSTYTGNASALILFQRYMSSNVLGQVSGTILEAASPVVRTVRLYHRQTGAFLKETQSNASGVFSFDVGSSGPFYVVALDDDAGVNYNAKIFDKVQYI